MDSSHHRHTGEGGVAQEHLIGLPEDEEYTHKSLQTTSETSRFSGRGLAQMLRQTVATMTTIATVISDSESVGSRIRGGGSTEIPDEIEDIMSKYNDLESVYSIEEEEEVRQQPMRRRSYSEGELFPLMRRLSSDDLASYHTHNRSPSPTLSEVSHDETMDNSISNGSRVNPALRVAVATHHYAVDNIDFSDSTIKWKQGEFLGEGSFGRVFKGMNEATGELIAVKQLFLSSNSAEEVRLLRKEISVMWDLNHTNIVR
jgi:hypothetical protein